MNRTELSDMELVKELSRRLTGVPMPGDRIDNGGRSGVIIVCPECDGDGTLHEPDELPPFSLAIDEDFPKDNLVADLMALVHEAELRALEAAREQPWSGKYGIGLTTNISNLKEEGITVTAYARPDLPPGMVSFEPIQR